MRIHHTATFIAAAFLAWASASETHAIIIHQWDFSEGTGATAADTVGGATGVIDGATWDSDATRDTFLRFDGANDRVDPSLVFPTLSQADASSWTFWVNVDPGQEDGNGIIVGNRRDGAGNDIGPGTRNFLKITPRGRFNFHQGGGKDRNFAALPAEEWTHVAFSRDGDQLTWYINGEAFAPTNGDMSIPTTISSLAATPTEAMLPFYMGGEPNQGGSEHFAGGLDDVRIYDHALTAEEVAQSMLPLGLPIPGDVDDSGTVDTDDLLEIRNNYFNTVTGTVTERFALGDMNGDSIVDFLDYRIWKDNYVPAGAGSGLATVPEPACLALALLGGVTLLGVRRRA